MKQKVITAVIPSLVFVLFFACTEEKSATIPEKQVAPQTKTVSPSVAIPAYKVVGRSGRAAALLVEPHTTDDEIASLIHKFREMRQGGSLSTTPLTWFFIFKESEWATDIRLDKYIKASMKSLSDKEYSIEFAQHVAGEYYAAPTQEYGTVGIKDEYVQSSNYKKLF